MPGKNLIIAAYSLTFIMVSGAMENSHWSLKPLKENEIPSQKNSPWVKNPIDAFVLEKLKEHNLSPQDESDRYTLMRRITTGLTGLSPTAVEIDSFIKDTTPDTYDRLVKRLLDSPHYGERWGRHWLDVARFGESDGTLTVNEDQPRKNAWKYRDSVIKAINADLPFNRFVRYQLSPSENQGEPNYKELRQFVHLGTRLQKNANPNDRQFHRLNDMVSTTGNAFLGLSFGCARCHDHPVDPMSTEEYYQFTALFFKQFKEDTKATRKKIPLKITEPRILTNGNWATPGKRVSPGFLKVLMKKPANHWLSEGKTEMESLGNWITDPEHGAGPLLARVIVNRLWHHHFGQGLVKTPNDFGSVGSKPTHHELLDWLAAKLIDNDWRLKPIHRLITTSATYTQKSSTDPTYLATDSDNTLLWHRRPQRLEAEIIRDRLLDVAGVLNKKMYGPSILIGNYKETVEDKPNSWRRSVYLQAHRTVQHPTLTLFNYPNTERSVGARSTSIGEGSALFSLNSPLVWTLSEHFAERVKTSVGKDPEKQIREAYMIALSRPPDTKETEIGLGLLKNQGDRALVNYCHLIFGLNEFIYIH